MMTVVRARPPCNSLLPPWCYVMPQGDVITVDNWVPAAKSKPLVKLADSAMRSTPKESELPSAFTVAERNVCAVMKVMILTDLVVTGPNGREVQPNFVAALTLWVEKLGLTAVSSDGARNCMFEALEQAFAKATDARTVRTAGGGKDDDP